MKFSPGFIERTKTLFSELYGRPITDEEADEIAFNAFAFIDALATTKRKSEEPYVSQYHSPALV